MLFFTWLVDWLTGIIKFWFVHHVPLFAGGTAWRKVKRPSSTIGLQIFEIVLAAYGFKYLRLMVDTYKVDGGYLRLMVDT